MKTLILVLLTIETLSSCHIKQDRKNATQASTTSRVFQVNKPPSSFSDTLIIKVSAAVFYQPDSLQLLKLKAIISTGDFESETHNAFYQMRNARTVIKKYWPGIRIMEATQARYLLFIKNNNERIVKDLNNQGDMFGIFLFDGKQDPELADMMNIDTFLGDYFKT